MPGFEFSPVGIVPLGSGPQVVAPEDVTAGGVGLTAEARKLPHAVEPSAGAYRASPSIQIDPRGAALQLNAGVALSSKQLLQLARKRVKDIKTELRKVPLLEAELASLTRLIEAAKQPKLKVARRAAVVAIK